MPKNLVENDRPEIADASDITAMSAAMDSAAKRRNTGSGGRVQHAFLRAAMRNVFGEKRKIKAIAYVNLVSPVQSRR
jgi:hypothetical protein